MATKVQHFDMHTLSPNTVLLSTPEDNLLYNSYKQEIKSRIPTDYIGRLRVYIEKRMFRKPEVLVYLAN